MYVPAIRNIAVLPAGDAPCTPRSGQGFAPLSPQCPRGTARLHLMRLARVAVVLDICCVLAFVIIGRDSHAKGESLAGIASTSWPFLCGLGVGWVASRA